MTGRCARLVFVAVLGVFAAGLMAGLTELSNAVAAKADDPVLASYELIKTADTKYHAKVKDYTANFLRWEVVNGKKPKEEEQIFTKLRNVPFSVYMKWNNTDHKGRELIYVAGKYNNKMKIHIGGLEDLLLPSFDLALDDPRLRAKTRHSIDEAGLGNTIRSLRRQWELGIKNGDIRVDSLERPSEIGGRPVAGFERRLPKRDCYYCGRLQVYLDTQRTFPVRIVTSDWNGKRSDGSWKYKMVERYTYKDLVLNPGLTDKDFDPRTYPGFGVSNLLASR